MNGTLYICGTPIGNLEDITFRQLRVLKEVDLIAAEDTRHTIKLLNHYKINCALTSYHEFNKKEKGQKIITELLNGKNVALVTDAGMPVISDPGEDIINLCYKNNIQVTTVPGPTAFVSALILSGFCSRQYVFEGFLSQNKKERKEALTRIKKETRTLILYEAPHRLTKTLKTLKDDAIEPTRRVAIVRELTKKYEEVVILTVEDAITYYTENSPKGEFVIVIEGNQQKEEQSIWQEMSIIQHVNMYIKEGNIKKDAIKLVAKDRNLPKSEIYNEVMKK